VNEENGRSPTVATLLRDGDSLILELTTGEKLESVHGNVRVPYASIVGVDDLDDPIDEVHGLAFGEMKIAGAYIPGHLAVGTFRVGADAKRFIAVHAGHPRGVRIRLSGASFSELLVSGQDTESLRMDLPQL
jgi:hypothetical protein